LDRQAFGVLFRCRADKDAAGVPSFSYTPTIPNPGGDEQHHNAPSSTRHTSNTAIPDDHLGGGVTVDGPVELVLHGREKALGGGGASVVVDGGGVDVGDLLVELALAEPDFADALKLFLEILACQDGATVFEALVVHGKALDGEFLDHGGRPLAELDGALRVDLVADRDDGREVVVLRLIELAVSSSYPKFSDNCHFLQFTVLVAAA